MTNKNASTPTDGDTELAAGISSTTLAETGEVEIAGRRYVTDRRLAESAQRHHAYFVAMERGPHRASQNRRGQDCAL